MAAIGPWGTFIHIPKTGGQWASKVLHQLDPGTRSGFGHDLPDNWDKEPIWTIIREPASWLGSAWAHRVRENWHMYPHKIPWQHFCKMTEMMATNDFEIFVDRVTTETPGLITWFYRCYTPPIVQTVRYGKEMYAWLKELGCNPDLVEPMNTGFNSPEITEEIRNKVWESEKESYDRYGFSHLGEYFYTLPEDNNATSR